MPNKYCVKTKYLLEGIEVKFNKMFDTRRIARKEFNTIGCKDLKDRNMDLIGNRVKNNAKIARSEWVEPIHVTARAVGLSNIPNLTQAMDIFVAAKRFYEKQLKAKIKQNLIISCEIGFDVILDQPNNTYNVHAHIICEKAEYLKMLAKTKDWRKGSKQSLHYLNTRICPRNMQLEQTNQEYVNKVFNYNSKFTLHQGDSRVKKSGIRSISHAKTEYTLAYATQKSKMYLRLPNKQKKLNKVAKSYKKLYIATKTMINSYNKWILCHIILKEKIALQKQALKNRKTDKTIEKLPLRSLVVIPTGGQTYPSTDSS